MHGPPPPLLSREAFGKCIAEGKDPLKVDGMRAWVRSRHRFMVAQAIALLIGAGVIFACIIVVAVKSGGI